MRKMSLQDVSLVFDNICDVIDHQDLSRLTFDNLCGDVNLDFLVVKLRSCLLL